MPKIWIDSVDPADWWALKCSSDFGMRVNWDGYNFYTPESAFCDVPAHFRHKLPKEPLDGFLRYNNVSNSLRNSYLLSSITLKSADWSRITFWVFDCYERLNEPLEKRIEHLKTILNMQTSSIRLVERERCRDLEDLASFMEDAIRRGDSGVLLQRSESLYHGGKSDDLLSVTVSANDPQIHY